MEIITGTQEELRKMINKAYKRIEKCTDKIQRYALIDYVSQLHDMMSVMTGSCEQLDQVRCLGSYKKQRKYYDYLDSLFDKLDENFIRYRNFHNDLFDDVLGIQEDVLTEFLGMEYSDGSTEISKEEFYQYFFEFLQTYGLEKRFDRFIENKRLFSRPLLEDDRFYGCCLHDPIQYDSSIFFCDFKYNLQYLLTMAHEFGHTYDLSKIKGQDAAMRNLRYSYSSAYGEVISMMFEKLFYDYLFDKKYRVEQVKDLALDHNIACNQNVLSMYMLTLLSNETIFEGPGDVAKTEILMQVAPYFEDPKEIEWFVEARNFDTWKDPAYAYGEFLSTILKENVKEEGLDSEIMRTFNKEKTKLFNPQFVVDNGFSVDSYQKIYRRDAKRLKK